MQVIVRWDMDPDVVAVAQHIRVELTPTGTDAGPWVEAHPVGIGSGQIKTSDFIPIDPEDVAQSDSFIFDARLSPDPPDFANPAIQMRFPTAFLPGQQRRIHFTFEASCLDHVCENPEETCFVDNSGSPECAVPVVNASGEVVRLSDQNAADGGTSDGGGICLGPNLDTIIQPSREFGPIAWFHPFPILGDIKATCAVSDSEGYALTEHEVLRFSGGQWSADLVAALVGDERDMFIDITCSLTDVWVIGTQRIYERGTEGWTVRVPDSEISAVAIHGDLPTVVDSMGGVHQGETLAVTLPSDLMSLVGTPTDVLAIGVNDVFVSGPNGLAHYSGGAGWNDLAL